MNEFPQYSAENEAPAWSFEYNLKEFNRALPITQINDAPMNFMDFFDSKCLVPDAHQKLQSLNEAGQPPSVTDLLLPRTKYEDLPFQSGQSQQPFLYMNEKENMPDANPLQNIGHWQNSMYSMASSQRSVLQSVPMSTVSVGGGSSSGSTGYRSDVLLSSQGSTDSKENALSSPTFSIDHFAFMPTWSPKVFMGGLPQDITVDELKQQLLRFGQVSIDWPHRDRVHDSIPPHGFVFAVFSESSCVDKLMNHCVTNGDRMYVMIHSTRCNAKQVQVRPWRCSDAEHVVLKGVPINDRYSVFIGGLPRTIRAQELAEHFESRWGSVISVRIDVDAQHGYPKGSARVNFLEAVAFMNALQGRFIELRGADFQPKNAEIKAYVSDHVPCDSCKYADKTFFCGQPGCMRYLCLRCWSQVHVPGGMLESHRATVKNRSGRRRVSTSLPTPTTATLLR